MARKKEQQEVIPEVKKRRRKKVELPVVPPACWEVCSKFVVKDGTDYVHICLGNVFVTQSELTRMMSSELTTKENVKQ